MTKVLSELLDKIKLLLKAETFTYYQSEKISALLPFSLPWVENKIC